MALRIGFGEYNATPPLGVEMAGYAKREGVADDVHDPLWARAMVFDDGETAAAVVVVDTIGVNADHVDRMGRLVEKWTGIPRKNVIAAGTHTHSGPQLPGLSGARRRRGPNEVYSESFPHLLASAVKLAWDDRKVATMAAAVTRTRDLTVNRRDPGGTTDEELTVLCIRRRGQIRGAVLNYACHGVVMGPDNLALSGDWIALARAALTDKMPQVFPLVAVAPSGNINPLPRSIRKQLKEKGPGYFTNDPHSGIYDRTGGTFAEAEQMARSIAQAAVRAVQRAEPAPGTGGVAVTTRVAGIGKGRTSIGVPLRMIRVGQVVFIGMPGEQFVETGAQVKEAVRARGLIPIVVTHSPTLAYVPTPDAFAQNKAHDYEVDMARHMGMAEDATERELAAIEAGLCALTK